jgi:hypothetical protein
MKEIETLFRNSLLKVSLLTYSSRSHPQEWMSSRQNSLSEVEVWQYDTILRNQNVAYEALTPENYRAVSH